MSQLWVGRTLGGRYKLDNLLGAGGMSAVYRAFDPNLRRFVAVKIIHPHLSEDPNFIERFKEEAAAVASLRHPNIVQVHDFNHEGDTYYMVMDYLAGETLQARLRRVNAAGRYLPLDEIIRISQQICDAAGYAHRHELIHRDIKPANIMLDLQGQAILMDFGIVKIIGGQYHTSTGATVGTAIYMSPEQIRSERVDERSDIYSMGVMLFEMLSGRPPYQADSALTLMMMHLNDPIPNPGELRASIPAEFIAVVVKALAKERSQRYQNAAEMLLDLNRLQAMLPFEIKETLTTDSFTSSPRPGSSQIAEVAPDEAQLTPTVEDSGSFERNIEIPDIQKAEIEINPPAAPALAEVEVKSFTIPDESKIAPAPTPVPAGVPDQSVPLSSSEEIGGVVFEHAAILAPDKPQPRKERGHPSKDISEEQLKVKIPKTGRGLRWVWMAFGLIVFLLLGVGGAWLYIQRQPPAEEFMPIEHPSIPISLETYSKLVRLGQWEVDSVSEELAFSPDGDLLAADSNRDWVRYSPYRYYASLWTVSTGNLDRHLLAHTNWMHSLSFSPDGALLATSAEDEQINIWQVQDGTLLRTIESGGGSVASLDFAPNGKIIAGSTSDGASLWQVSNGNLLTTYSAEGSELSAVSFSPDGELLAGGSHSGMVFIWHVGDRTLFHVLTGHTEAIYQMAFSPDGSRIVSASGDHSLKLWEVSDGKLIATLTGHSDGVTGVAFSADGTLLASASWDGTLRLWHGINGTPIDNIEIDESITSLAFSPDGALLVIGTDKALQFWGITDVLSQ